MIEKPVISAEDAAGKIKDSDVLMVGGFLGCGSPDAIIKALLACSTKNLTLIGNDTGILNQEKGIATGPASLVASKRFKKLIVTHIGTNKESGRQMNSGETEVELVPQGTLAERIRSAGVGIGGFLTPTGIGTEVENGKKIIEVSGKKYLLEEAISADVAIIKAAKSDKSGNLIYSKSARNFNPLMAMSAKIVIAEVDEIVEIGEIDPEIVTTPFIFIDYLVKSK